MSRRVKLIFNPHADNRRAWNVATDLQAIIDQHGGADWSATEHPTHATKLVLQAAREGFNVVAALGGDGTVHEMVNGLMQVPAEQRPMLAAVPLGSGNDFCANVGVEANVERAMQRVFSGAPKPVDVGLIRDSSGREEYWNNSLGIGFDALTVINTHRISRLQGLAMYLLAVVQTILRDLEAPRMKIETDREVIERDLLMFTICNGPREGGGFYLAPDAQPDDGVFDYTMVENVSRPMMFRLLPEFMRGTHARFKQVRQGRFQHLKLAADRPLVIHTDGEIFAGATSDVCELHVDVLPGAIQMIT